MDMNEFLSAAGIPLLMVLVLGYYSMRLLVLHDVDAVRGKNQKKVKNPEQYAKEAGKLMMFLAAASLVMAGLICWNTMAAIVEIIICVIIFGLLWKKMDKKYGG
jgi:hypothetical protein